MSSSAITTNPYQAKSSDVQNSDGSSLATKVVTGMVVTDSPLMFRNRIINGDMRIDQRNAGANVSLGGFTEKHIADRFLVARNGGAATLAVIQQVTTISGATNFEANSAPAGFTHALKVQIGTAQAVGTGNETEIKHSLEGFTGADWNWGTADAKPVTLSFWVKSSQTGNFGVGMRSATFNYSIVTSYTINAANTWEYKTITITPPTSGTFYQDSRLHHTLYWDLGVGSTFSTSALNTWQSADLRGGLTGGVKLAETAGANFYITGVQLEAGPTATPFERRPIGTELALCQRYYQRGLQNRGASPAYATSGVSFRIPLITTMRVASPGTQISGTSLTNCLDKTGIASYTPTSISFLSAVSTDAVHVDFGGTYTQYQPLSIITDIIQVSAEL